MDLDAVFGSSAKGLVDRLAIVPGWRERFAVLNEVLVGRLKEGAAPPPEVAHAWQLLVSAAGAVEVAALADDVGYSRRHLGELFRRELGLAPKVASRILRFEHSRRLIERGEQRTLADVAATAGYYDQAHMTREWGDIAGCPPTTWIVEELPSVQDPPVEISAD